MSNKNLRYIILVGIFAIPFVPLVVSSSLFFPFITGKGFVFRIIVEIIFAAYLVLAVRDEAYRPKFSWIMGSVLVFLIAIGLADVFAVNPMKAFWSNYERMEGYILILHLAALFVVMGSMLKTQKMWNSLLSTSLFGSFLMSVYSFFQLAGRIPINQGGVRVDGTLGNASYLGIYMVFHIFFAALLFARSQKTWQRILLGLIALMDTIILYHTATRGAILGLLGGAFVSFVFLALRSEKGSKIRKSAAAGFITLVAVIGLFFVFKNTSFVQNSPVLGRFSTISFAEIQTQGRYYVWPMAIKGFVEKPLLGWGQEGFNFVFNKYYDPRMYGQEPWFDRAHNTFLDWMIAGGSLGILSYLAIIFSLAFYIFKANEDFLNREDKAIMLGVLSAYLFNNLFVFDQISSYILFFTILAYVHAHTPEANSSLWERISLKLRSIFEEEKWHPVAESIIFIALITVFYFVVFVPWKHNKQILDILRIENESKAATIDQYKLALTEYDMGFPESLEHISQVAINMAGDQNVSSDLKQQLFTVVDQAFQKQISNVPEDARYRLFYGLFLSRFGWYGRAVEQLKKAVELSPNKQTIYFELINNLILDNKKPEALEAARIAYEADKDFTQARIVYGLVAIENGDIALGNQLFSGINESSLIFDDRYLSALLSLGQTQKIIEVAQKRVELDPGNIQHRITLAAAYLNAGMRQNAINVIEDIIKLDPTFKEKGEYYIGEIKAGRNP